MPNPFNFGNPVPPHKFTGRWHQVNAIAEDLTNSEGHSHAIIGGRRFGKSSFLEALQHVLIEQLNQTESGDWYAFPVLINLKRSEKGGTEGVFGLILNRLYDYFTGTRLRQELGLLFGLDLTNTKLFTFINENRNECTPSEFEKIIDQFLNIFEDAYGFIRLVLLMDEAEAVIHKDWTEALFDRLRSLVYEGDFRRYVRLVIAGSSEITEVRQAGSPLFNMLKLTYLEAFPKEEILKIIGWAGDVSPEIAEAILQQCGGHPFIAQYLMHHVWETGISSATEDVVISLADKFRHERHADLYRWQREIGTDGQLTYRCLEAREEWFTEEQLREFLHDREVKIDLAVVALCHHGVAIHDVKWRRYRYSGELFKRWFTDNVLPSLPEQSAPTGAASPPPIKAPRLTVTVKDQIFPTAYCYSLTEKEYPLITCEIDATDSMCPDCRASIEMEIQGYSDLCSDTFEIRSGTIGTVSLLPTITPEARLSLNEIRRAECRVVVRQHERTGSGLLHDKTYGIQLHAADTALLATIQPDNSLTDLTDYLAVFVTPHRPEMEEVVKKAANRHPDLAIVGYQGAQNLEDARELVRTQANMFFNTLKQDYKLLYTNAPLNFGKQAGQITQRVRLPIESLRMGQTQANCIDGTVLFASLLENVGIEPLLAIVPGHAFVGWRIWEGVNEYDFLETTMIGASSFREALEVGNNQYQHVVQQGFAQHPLFDQNGFLRIVDVAACREKGINPCM